jgi:hypothetical protein
MKSRNDHALAILNTGQIAESVTILRDEAWRRPSYKAYVNLASALRHAGEFDDAIRYAARAIKEDVSHYAAWLILANISTEVGDWGHALGYYHGAWERVHRFSDVESYRLIAIGYASALLRERRFKEAWPLWEFGRFERSYSALPGTKRWLGEPCDRLLVVCEGGFGDAMLFGRWLPFCKRRARHVKLLIWDAMTEFRDWRALGIDEVIPKSRELDFGCADYTTSWMSLPGIAGMRSVADIPRDDDFCTYNKGTNGAGSSFCIDNRGTNIGFCWRAEEAGTLRKCRSLSTEDASALAIRLAAHGQPLSLVPAKAALYRKEEFALPSGVTQDDTLIEGWQETANTIRSCKFVVTVDTAVAHLAGLCGVPTLILLPSASEWKWGTPLNTPIDPWYGGHICYFRNLDPLKWDVERIALTVNAFVQVAVA